MFKLYSNYYSIAKFFNTKFIKHWGQFCTGLLCCLLFSQTSIGQETLPASNFTIEKHKNLMKTLPFANETDFQSVQRGFIGHPPDLKLLNKAGDVVWNLKPFLSFENTSATDAPHVVNPSLWRQSLLNLTYGLFKVTDHIYQVRGYDLAVMTIIEGKTGYILVDPLTTAETAHAALDLVYEYLPKKPVVAVIYTHAHVDHFGGVKGVVNEQDVKDKKVKIIAPKGFMESAISENVLAGNVMSRRASYMYGGLLPKTKYGMVDNGLGKAVSEGRITLIPPTTTIDHTGQKLVIDGVTFVFQYTPNTESPSEMNFYLPQYKALCMAENATHTLHNLYSLRGAQVRDSFKWVTYLSQTIDLYGKDAQVEFASHHWPTWGNANIVTFLKSQRDTYKYLHDQTLRLANEGFTMNEIAEQVHLPASLEKEWYNHGYYGTVSHDVKAIYQYYLGWFDGNPAHLNPLPPVEAAEKYVAYMGGAAAIIQKAKKDYAAGEYRWVAEVLNQVVFADPNNQSARDLLADTYEQLGYQSESASWRNFYLSGAQELRDGVKQYVLPNTVSPDVIQAMTMPMILDYLAIRLNGPKAADKNIRINLDLPDVHEKYALQVENGVLNYRSNQNDPQADVTVRIDRKTLNALALSETNIVQVIKKKEITVTGNKKILLQFFGLLDKFDYWFNIVTPNTVKKPILTDHAA